MNILNLRHQLSRWHAATANAVPFAPFLFTGIAVAGVYQMSRSAPNSLIASQGLYMLWLALSISAPMLLALSWLMTTKMSGTARYAGYWLRLAADAAMMWAVAAFDLPHLAQDHPTSLVLRLTIQAFLIASVAYDVSRLLLVARVAQAIRRVDHG